MKSKNLITISDLTKEEIFEILEITSQLKKEPFSKKEILKDKTLALLFQKPSNRTRISFEVGMFQLGGYTLYLSPREIDMGGRESVKDVACVLSRYVDCIVGRVFSHDDIVQFAENAQIPVINGLSDFSHPCQAISDIFTIKEKFGSFDGVKIAYVGDGNNVLNSLLKISAKVGLDINIGTPKGYEPLKEVVNEACSIAEESGAKISLFNDPFETVKGCDVVYTDVWVSMGQEKEKAERLKVFKPFQVNAKLMESIGKNAYIMHCLPAHRGEEITDIMDTDKSIVYDQAENRMHGEKAILLKLMT